MANPLTKAKKESEVKELADKIGRAKGVIFTDFRGLTVEDTTDIRKKFRKQKLEYKVIKNNIIRRALEKTSLKDLEKYIDGPTGVVISYEDPVVPAKLLKDFSAEHENMKIRVGLVEGKVADVAMIKFVAGLPAKEVLIAKVLGGMKAPIANFVFALKGVLNKFVYTLEAVKKTKK